MCVGLGNSSALQDWSPFTCLVIGLVTFALVCAITILYILPFHSFMPVMAGTTRTVLDACCQLELPMSDRGIKWGDISTQERRIIGFGESEGGGGLSN